MKRTWLAVVSCVVGLQLTQTGSIAPVAFANGGGTGIIIQPGIPPMQSTTPGSLTLPVEGKVAGAADGSLRLVFTLSEGSVELYSETRAVVIDDGKFSTRLGTVSADGIPVSTLAGTKNAVLRWAKETTPSVTEGSQYMAAAPYAMTLSPGAQIKSSGIAPALIVSNTSTGVKATASSNFGRAVVGESTSSSGNSYGVEGRAQSPSGAAGHFINTAGDLIVGRAEANGDVKFRVANNGDVYVRGVKVGQQGPKGDKGEKGDKGSPGSRGDTGPRGDPGPGAASTFCVEAPQTTCTGVCTGGSSLVASTVSPCATSNGCSYGSTGRVCCVCASTN